VTPVRCSPFFGAAVCAMSSMWFVVYGFWFVVCGLSSIGMSYIHAMLCVLHPCHGGVQCLVWCLQVTPHQQGHQPGREQL
jgi:hypothetical protein